jgi:cytochrome c biogenesis protein CcmG/thiol:disulfide interchange protein DsbE
VKSSLDKLLLFSIVLLAVGLVWIVSGTLEERIINAGDTAPDFTVTTDTGKTITRDNFGGKLLVLNFWASWCGPCVDEEPSLVEFSRMFGPQGVVVLGVSSDANEKLYSRFIQRFGVTFPTARDPEQNIAASYGTFQIPETYLIDKHGKVLEKVISNQDWMAPDFIARVRRML